MQTAKKGRSTGWRARTRLKHSHPAYVIYPLDEGKVKFNSPSGETAEIEMKAGDVMWREPEGARGGHIGSTEAHALLFELK